MKKGEINQHINSIQSTKLSLELTILTTIVWLSPQIHVLKFNHQCNSLKWWGHEEGINNKTLA